MAYSSENHLFSEADNTQLFEYVRKIEQKNDSIQMFIGIGNYQQASKLAEQNIHLATNIENWELALENYEKLVNIDSITNNFNAAFKHLKEKEIISHKLFMFQKEEIINDSIKRQSIEKIYQQIIDLENELKTTEEKVQSSVQLISVMSVVVCLLFVITVVQILRFKKYKRANNTLTVEYAKHKHDFEEMMFLVDEYYDDNQKLIQENDSLEKSNAVKDKLLSIISHDLRSPMSSLQALLGLFNTNSIARTDLVDFFGKLLSRVENTSTMLENLLHWSQYQLKGLEPIFDRIDMQMIIDECINLYRMQAEQKHIVIDNTLKTSVHVWADVEMLKVILRNLISNALKFTHSGGIITIKSLTKDHFAIVSVRDTGVGISPENQARMFAVANFTTPGTEKEKGTGLGLMLCKDFVEHNQGKIWLDSKVNVGTTFNFSIPLVEE